MRSPMLALALLALVVFPGEALAARPPRPELPPLYSQRTHEPSGTAESASSGTLSAIALAGDPAPHPNDVYWEGMPLPFFFADVPPAAFADFAGQLVLGGAFAAAGTARTRGVASWDGTHFHGMGTLPGSGASALQVWGGVLYATTTYSREVYRWDGTAWELIGTADGNLTSLAVFGGELVAGGTFTTMEGLPATNVAAFNGTNWHALPGLAAASSVNALRALGPYLYAGVYATSGIYRWDGASWSVVGVGLNNAVEALTDDGTNLYAAGSFTKSGPDSMPGVARWTGAQWQRVGIGVTANISAIAWWNGSLYINTLYKLARFDGTNWVPVPPPFTNRPGVLGVSGGRLLATGTNLPTGPADQYKTALWDGTTWTPVREGWSASMTGLDWPNNSATLWNDHLVVGGNFRYAGTGSQAIPISYEAQWDGTAWSALGATSGAGPYPYALAPWGSELVAVGWVGATIPGPGHSFASVAHWDGSAWQVFKPNMYVYTWAAVEHLGSLYVGGEWATDDAAVPDTLEHVARWTGSGWQALGGGLRPDFAIVSALASWNGKLAAGGVDITLAGNQPVSNIALWDGGQWSALGAGLDDWCYALTAWNGVLVAGGKFLHAGGLDAPGAAFWDGASWHPMGSEAKEIYDFTQLDGVLYAVGEFRREDASVTNTAARWTGASWQILGSGGPGIDWVEAYHGDLYVGGGVSYAFGKVTHGILRLPAASTVGVENGPAVAAVALAASPNPGRGATTFAFSLPRAGRVRLAVYDAAGRVATTLVDGEVPAGRHEAHWSAAAAPGVYFARLDAPGGERRLARVVRFE